MRKAAHAPELLKLQKLQKPIQLDLDLVEEKLREVLGAGEGVAGEVSDHILSGSGKRLRPILVLLVSRLFPRKQDHAITAAVALELVHTATLVHDDAIDDSALRRGRVTVNARWGENISLIFGDYLYSRSFMLMGEAGLHDAMRVVASATHLMTQGEMLQWERRGDLDISEEDYLRIVRHKTASLFSAACQVGLSTCEDGDGLARDVVSYGEHLGVAYQMVDDLLDFVGAERFLGKPVGGDLREGRVTLPLIRALQGADEKERAEFLGLIRSGGLDNGGWPEIVNFVSRNGGIEYCHQKVRQHGEAAKLALARVESGDALQALLAIADYVIGKRE
ncbi:MAG: polyprenyl synthetase family protein [Candidatus Eisenbacteria sp.]|nr:polyprenyl synthetase family protein [Candidatus Eisenbacteria bacterium]